MRVRRPTPVHERAMGQEHPVLHAATVCRPTAAIGGKLEGALRPGIRPIPTINGAILVGTSLRNTPEGREPRRLPAERAGIPGNHR